MRDFLAVDNLTREEFYALLDRADRLYALWTANALPQTLKGKRVALWFFGQGFRNRIAFELGARALGADVSFVPGELGIHEPIEDIARYLDNWFSLLVIRCRTHADLLRVAADAKAPVINARTDWNHPCEILGDLHYIRRKRGSLEGLRVVFVGEVTNLCNSWFEAARVLPIEVVQAGPEGYLATPDRLAELNRGAAGRISTTADLNSALNRNTDVLYTDCWPHGTDRESLKPVFLPYQITRAVVDKMNPEGFYLPCPPVTRGEELTEDSLTAPQFCDYAAKEFLLYAQNAVMEWCLGVTGEP